MTISPPYLKPGDTILIIATARKVSRGEIEPAKGILEGWGLKVETGPNLYGDSNQFSGTDTERCSDLQWALDHPSAAAVLIARGGYGTIRIIDGVSFKKFDQHPKWLIGFSD